MSRTEISAIETGRLLPSVAVALRLASALGQSVETLFGGAGVPAAATWAWSPRDAADGRVWRASVNGRLLLYPVEPTAAGAIPHDAFVRGSGTESIASESRPERTLVLAGCDPLVGLLAQEIGTRHDVRVLPLLRSSTQALALLRQGLVHMAGVHLTDPDGESANGHAVQSSLGSGYCLIHQLRWDAGVAFDPKRRERSLLALLRANLRWVNREDGSAARKAFDVLLGSRRRPKGYHHLVGDHRAVAAIISSGWAEAGMCVRPAAAEAHLSFMPMQQEAYELCVAESLLDDPRVAALTSTLRSLRYRRIVGDVPGCVSSDTGALRAIA